MMGPINLTGNKYNDTVTYSCIEGYEITNTASNSTTITCQSDKTWSAPQTCSSEFTKIYHILLISPTQSILKHYKSITIYASILMLSQFLAPAQIS